MSRGVLGQLAAFHGCKYRWLHAPATKFSDRIRCRDTYAKNARAAFASSASG